MGMQVRFYSGDLSLVGGPDDVPMYTVPAGLKLYLTSLYWESNVLAPPGGVVTWSDAGFGTSIWLADGAQKLSASRDFTRPYLIATGNILVVRFFDFTVGTVARCGGIGFLE